MKIHTLGPYATDSNAAAIQYNQSKMNCYLIELHASFEEIVANLAKYQNDYLLLPAAFKSRQMAVSWGELHYQYLDQLELVDSFQNPLAELVIVENTKRKTGIGYTHAATAHLLATKTNLKNIKCCKSKYEAYQKYLIDGQYVLTNFKNITLNSDEKIGYRVTPKMIWCLYLIKNK